MTNVYWFRATGGYICGCGRPSNLVTCHGIYPHGCITIFPLTYHKLYYISMNMLIVMAYCHSIFPWLLWTWYVREHQCVFLTSFEGCFFRVCLLTDVTHVCLYTVKPVFRGHLYTVKPVFRGHLYTVKPVFRGHLYSKTCLQGTPLYSKTCLQGHLYAVKPVFRGHLYTVKPVFSGHLHTVNLSSVDTSMQ